MVLGKLLLWLACVRRRLIADDMESLLDLANVAKPSGLVCERQYRLIEGRL